MRWVPPAYGSLTANWVPGSTSVPNRSRIAPTEAGIEPRCTGMCSAWASISPEASNRAAEQSARSFMFGEYAVRCSTVPMSSAIELRRLRATSSVIGSTLTT